MSWTKYNGIKKEAEAVNTKEVIADMVATAEAAIDALTAPKGWHMLDHKVIASDLGPETLEFFNAPTYVDDNDITDMNDERFTVRMVLPFHWR